MWVFLVLNVKHGTIKETRRTYIGRGSFEMWIEMDCLAHYTVGDMNI